MHDDIIFIGTISPDGITGTIEYEIEQDGWQRRRVPLFLDEVNHSPTGFMWGYTGSGPAQSAYAILRVFSNSEKFARDYHHAFQQDVISRLNKEEGWTFSGEQIDKWFTISILGETGG